LSLTVTIKLQVKEFPAESVTKGFRVWGPKPRETEEIEAVRVPSQLSVPVNVWEYTAVHEPGSVEMAELAGHTKLGRSWSTTVSSSWNSLHYHSQFQ
jgi:hypothetical protein